MSEAQRWILLAMVLIGLAWLTVDIIIWTFDDPRGTWPMIPLLALTWAYVAVAVTA